MLPKTLAMAALSTFWLSAGNPAGAGPVTVNLEEGSGHARVTAAGATDEETVPAVRSATVLFAEAHAARVLPANGVLFGFDAAGGPSANI
jgi:hypothetical protein